MKVLISAEGQHDPPWHYVAVDDVGLLVDLSGVSGTLHDPSILRVQWGPADAARESGTILRRGGTVQVFFDRGLLDPYVAAWRARRQALAGQAGGQT